MMIDVQFSIRILKIFFICEFCLEFFSIHFFNIYFSSGIIFVYVFIELFFKPLAYVLSLIVRIIIVVIFLLRMAF